MLTRKDLKILVVDDSLGIRLAAKKIFSNLGYNKVAVADDGTTALAKLQEEPFDLVVADWNMQEMSGIELLKEMQADDSLKEIPFLLVTGEEEQDNLLDAIKAGISNFMKKPYNAKVLSEKIERIFAFKEELHRRKRNSAV
ncbi:MAG: response regulator [Proteobacteria bacterium]|nr:response regulator [Pseudomonadota bacterium]